MGAIRPGTTARPLRCIFKSDGEPAGISAREAILLGSREARQVCVPAETGEQRSAHFHCYLRRTRGQLLYRHGACVVDYVMLADVVSVQLTCRRAGDQDAAAMP